VCTPLVAVWLNDAIYFSTGGAEQKAVKLRANPHVVSPPGAAPGTRGFVVVEGDAVPSLTTNCCVPGRLRHWSARHGTKSH